ncbi:MAG: hypothetical protein DMG21_04900 [Acidobacteria bacterium]|nr:MAG: hypothetical protein DMG21_04900 [Acidobacteriota bacterium]
MPKSSGQTELDAVRERATEFLRSLRHPVLYEDGAELFDLTAARWNFSIEFGKLLLEVWNPNRSIGRRVEEIAYTDRDRMGLYVRKPGAREATTLEFRELKPAGAGSERPAARSAARDALVQLLKQEFREWKIERASIRSDREHSFSAWYIRGLARQGRTGWAFLGMDEHETPAAADSVLSYALIWLDWLRARSERLTIPGLKLFLPPGAARPTAERVSCLNRRSLDLEIFAWNRERSRLERMDLADIGNVSTGLAHSRQSEQLLETHRNLVHELAGDRLKDIDIFPDAPKNTLSLRVRGLEVAWIEGLVSPRIFFGLEGEVRRLEEEGREDFRRFLDEVLRIRAADSREPSHPFYRLQAERWLESLLIQDVTKIDPELSPQFVYPQVPAFSGSERGVIDILAATRGGRLAVLELKLDEQINLPMQGLDYWLRVKWLADRKQFGEYGYFPGVELAPALPRLYLVSPGFRFHSSTDRLICYFHPAIEVIKVGLNQTWRKGIRVLFRKAAGSDGSGGIPPASFDFAHTPEPDEGRE